jgi:peptidoglycan/xylan/chitin deacetylase (PgdA/CDA1 family)
MISVVIPARDEEQYLPACLASLQKQDYDGEYEILVVDNASTDNTGRIARKSGARVIFCPRTGVAYARQAGANSARGDIIVQADADTIYPQDWLTRIARHFLLHPDSIALAGRYIYKDPPRWAFFQYFWEQVINLIGLVFFGRPVWVSGANFAFRREAFLRVKGYNSASLYPDQWGISRQLSRLGKVRYDRRLRVMTSARRVKRPLYLLASDIIMNIARIMRHFHRHNAKFLQKSLAKIPVIRSPVRLIICILIASVISLLAVGYALPTSQVFGKVYYQSRTSEKIVALSFDDGPNEPYTSEILAILDDYGAKATFFAVGKNVELYPATAKRIIAEGNALENHSYSHKANHAVTNAGAADIRLAENAIFNVTGVKPSLYRPPHGKKTPWELYSIKHENLSEVTWDVAANDQHEYLIFGKPTPEELAKEIVSKVKPGRIILLHDGYGTNHGDAKSDKSLTVKALPIIIKELQSQGYRFVTIPQLIGMPAYLNSDLP